MFKSSIYSDSGNNIKIKNSLDEDEYLYRTIADFEVNKKYMVLDLCTDDFDFNKLELFRKYHVYIYHYKDDPENDRHYSVDCYFVSSTRYSALFVLKKIIYNTCFGKINETYENKYFKILLKYYKILNIFKKGLRYK